MAGMEPVGTFVVWDYLVFALMLLLSAIVGFYYAMKGSQSSQEFLMGGRQMSAVPVALSLSASFLSAVTVLALPAEVYQNGAIFGLYGICYVLVIVISSEVYLPIFYRLGVNSSYEYLEMRFNRATRLIGTVMFILQSVLYTGIVIYTPALALSMVTGFHLWGAVLSTGAVCILYCTLGGLKAVVWTDVCQMGVMLAGFLAVVFQAIVMQGGIMPILNDAELGGRLNFWDFDPSPLRRHTFWTILIGGGLSWIAVYGVNQAQVQRYISCKSLTEAKLSLYVNLIGLWLILLSAVFSGLCLYSIYKNCDPWTAGLLSAPDQLMPYLVMDILRDFPGLPGLFVAAAYSGTLSTVSSSINALAAVTVEDLMKPYNNMSEKNLYWASKVLTLLYGVVCIGMAGITSLLGGLIEAATSIYGVFGGPILGVFTLGILFPCANTHGGLVGLCSGLVISLWASLGSRVHPPPLKDNKPLSLSTAGCNFSTTYNLTFPVMATAVSTTSLDENMDHSLMDQWYSLSYLYLSPLGMVTAITVGLVVSLLTGGRKEKLAPGLTLRKEDLTGYVLYKRLIHKMTKPTSKDLEKPHDMGKSNPAFSRSVLDLDVKETALSSGADGTFTTQISTSKQSRMRFCNLH